MILPANFNALSPLEKRAAVEMATGLTWEQYSALPPEQQNALLLSLKGHTYASGTAAMLTASKKDAFWNRVGGYVSGMTAGGKLVVILAGAGLLWLYLPSIKTIPGKMREAIA